MTKYWTEKEDKIVLNYINSKIEERNLFNDDLDKLFKFMIENIVNKYPIMHYSITINDLNKIIIPKLKLKILDYNQNLKTSLYLYISTTIRCNLASIIHKLSKTERIKTI